MGSKTEPPSGATGFSNLGLGEFVCMLACLLVAALGGSVLVGWAFDLDGLKSILPGSVSMKVNTAFGFLVAGVALWLLRSPETNADTGAGRRHWPGS